MSDAIEQLETERMALCRIGATMPWLGDPFRIALMDIARRYREAEDVRRWKLGIGETEDEQADRVHQGKIRAVKREMSRALTAQR